MADIKDNSETKKSNAISLFEKYHDEISKLTSIDEFNMKQTQLELPSHRHYWVGRLMFHKLEVSKLQKAKKKAITQIIENLQNENPVTIAYKSLLASAENHPVVHKIEEQIAENEILIEYLSKIENNFRSMSYDIKNLIEIIRLETT
jgi:hypothetical protein